MHVLRQELVPAVADNAGRLALGARYELLMKPHGHGDILRCYIRRGWRSGWRMRELSIWCLFRIRMDRCLMRYRRRGCGGRRGV